MCYSNANIFFGLFVRTVDLVHAAMAWKEIERAFLALDMIVSRRTNGKLSVKGRARVKDVPQEVWAMIKDELCTVGVRMAGQALSKKLQCGSCSYNEALCDFRNNDCDRCYDVFWTNGSVIELFHGHHEVRSFFASSTSLIVRFFQQIETLLEAFHLYQPSSRLLVIDEPYYFDREACSAIAFSPRPSRTLLPSASPESTEETHGHEIVLFDPSIFPLPPNAANKILSFCRLFRLEFVDNTSTSMTKPKPDAAPQLSSASTTEQATQPRWQLWAMSECCP